MRQRATAAGIGLLAVLAIGVWLPAAAAAKTDPAGWAPGGNPLKPTQQDTADNQHMPGNCASNSVLLFRVRGSGESYGTDQLGHWAYAAGKAAIARGYNVREMQAIYSAPGVPFSLRPSTWEHYRTVDSREYQAVEGQIVRAYNRCRQRQILLAGYSSGGIIIRELVPHLPPATLRQIRRIDVVADPTEDKHSDRSLSDSSPWPARLTSEGLDTWSGRTVHNGHFKQTKYPKTVAGQTHQYCVPFDVVCDASAYNMSPANLAGEPRRHRSYPFSGIGTIAGNSLRNLVHSRGTGGVRTTPPFNECPPIGADTGCSVLIVIDMHGVRHMYPDPSQPAYDEEDDTMVGVVNESSQAVSSLTVTGPSTFDFDGDGLCTDSKAPHGCPFGPTGYEGPGTALTPSAAGVDAGTVSFPGGGLRSGDSTYFSLEGPATSLIAQAPTITNVSAAGTGQDSATVTATIDPQGADATWYVEYGADSSYGNQSDSGTVQATVSETPGADAQTVSADLSGLDPGTLYHYRVVASNVIGTTYGPDMTFGTAQGPHPVDVYSNYGPASAGHAMCRGNPSNGQSMPGGQLTQTFTVPAGVASLDSALVQIDPDASVTAHAELIVNGQVQASDDEAAAGDTHFSFGTVDVSPGDQAAIHISFTASFGKIITVYSAANTGGALSISNSCPAGAPSLTTGAGLRAVISGTST